MPTWPTKPAAGQRLDRAHPLAIGLSRCFVFDGTGTPTDLVRGNAAAQTNKPTWVTAPFGAARKYVGASSQSDDCGTWPEVAGLAQFTFSWLVRREGSSNMVQASKSSAFGTNDWMFYIGNDNFIYSFLSNAANGWGWFTKAGIDWLLVAFRFDGTQSTNATKLRGFLYGDEQTMSYTGTIPTTCATNTHVFQFGTNGSNGDLSTGQIAGCWFWTRALTREEIRSHAVDPWQMVTPLADGWRYGPLITIPPTVTFSNTSPAAGSTFQPYDGTLLTDATPTNVGNPITGRVCYLNGVACSVTYASLGPSGAERLTARGGAWAGAVNHVRWEVTTSDAHTNVLDYTYTATDSFLWSPRPALTDYVVPILRPNAALTDYVVPIRTASTALTDYVARAVGFLATANPALTDYAAVEAATGFSQATPAVTDYYATIKIVATLAYMSAVIAEFHATEQTAGASIQGTAHEVALGSSAAITGTEVVHALAHSAAIREDVVAHLLALSAVIAQRISTEQTMSAALERIRQALTGEYAVASEFQQQVEDEP